MRGNGHASTSNPTPCIGSTNPLPSTTLTSEDDARRLIRALVAQVEPVMRAHGLVVNDLAEYEYNDVFAGRNMNSGARVELVLRRKDGSFYSPSWLLCTLCHQLAHNKHKDHSPAFQAYWDRLRNDVRALQAEGHYGDGFWSSGARLSDAARIPMDEEMDATGLPEYICGGALERILSTRKKRRKRMEHGSVARTGAQTPKRRKAGARVTKDFGAGGRTLSGELEGEGDKRGAGFRKQTQSKTAREERAAAIERRLVAMQGGGAVEPAAPPGSSQPYTACEDSGRGSENESDTETVVGRETDAERRQALLESVCRSDPDADMRKVKPSNSRKVAKASMVKSEVALRKKENLGLALTNQRKQTIGEVPQAQWDAGL
ncbi:WLM-domain-containing protein [Punctularia strigosozonata HHB-11173 SS5]|uniref:WLM-domain-containing protein n=1 Tax=Punctularia strigosozonata (strain HHB-11173) TaxID=741275 RepID=UPI0004418512|nr:WLM-domain-containing protein [Punctularia strigosozonata HHB-11173 SS5]EIN09688.1 WLM-domain-containing protein [Punctularia strigosozonata HHB-11173 SS5]